MVYKVSFVIPGVEHGGAILNMPQRPQVGDHVQIGEIKVEVLEVVELLPPRGNFEYLHATCRVVEQAKSS